jgi:hypothetical protein
VDVEIRATGLAECGARLIPVVQGNPASATLAFTPAVQHMSQTFWVCFTAVDALGAASDTRCIRAHVVRPAPAFTAPIDPALPATAAVRATVQAIAGCSTALDIVAEDATSGEGVSPLVAAEKGYLLQIAPERHAVESVSGRTEGLGMPAGATLAPPARLWANPTSRRFEW